MVKLIFLQIEQHKLYYKSLIHTILDNFLMIDYVKKGGFLTMPMYGVFSCTHFWFWVLFIFLVFPGAYSMNI